MHGKQVSLPKYDAICDAKALGTGTWAERVAEFNVMGRKDKHTFLDFMLSPVAKVSIFSKARQNHCTSSALHHGSPVCGH